MLSFGRELSNADLYRLIYEDKKTQWGKNIWDVKWNCKYNLGQNYMLQVHKKYAHFQSAKMSSTLK